MRFTLLVSIFLLFINLWFYLIHLKFQALFLLIVVVSAQPVTRSQRRLLTAIERVIRFGENRCALRLRRSDCSFAATIIDSIRQFPFVGDNEVTNAADEALSEEETPVKATKTTEKCCFNDVGQCVVRPKNGICPRRKGKLINNLFFV